MSLCRHLSAKFLVLISLLGASPAFAFDESVNYQPALSLWSEASELTDLYGAHGSQLCAPIAITHGMQYLRSTAGFKTLASVGDIDHDGKADSLKDRIRYFFSSCATDRDGGTHYHQAQVCMSSYLQQSGFKPWVYIVGPHAINSPAGTPLQTMQHVLTINDVRNYVKQKTMVLMGVGWYNFDPQTKTYKRIGGHFFNVYGYNWNQAWGESRLELQAVNSLQNYSARVPGQMFDTLSMSAVPKDGSLYPSETRFVITGPGFNFVQKTLVEDIFVAWPVAFSSAP